MAAWQPELSGNISRAFVCDTDGEHVRWRRCWSANSFLKNRLCILCSFVFSSRSSLSLLFHVNGELYLVIFTCCCCIFEGKNSGGEGLSQVGCWGLDYFQLSLPSQTFEQVDPLVPHQNNKRKYILHALVDRCVQNKRNLPWTTKFMSLIKENSTKLFSLLFSKLTCSHWFCIQRSFPSVSLPFILV